MNKTLCCYLALAHQGHATCCADLYEHVRQETGRGVTPTAKGTPLQPFSQQPSSPAIAAVPAASPYQGTYSAASPAPTASPAPGPSYQDFESESDSSVSTTPGKLSASNAGDLYRGRHLHLSLACLYV